MAHRKKITTEVPTSSQTRGGSTSAKSGRRVAISNTTPLINFAEIGRMDLMQQLFGEIVIPMAVADELRAKSKQFPRAAKVCDLPFVRVQSAKNRDLVAILRHEIHAGEAECIVLALEQSSAVVILDDLAARVVAQQRGLPMIGTIGCLQVAKLDGLISQIGPHLRDLRDKARFWLSSRLIERVLEDTREGSIEE